MEMGGFTPQGGGAGVGPRSRCRGGADVASVGAALVPALMAALVTMLVTVLMAAWRFVMICGPQARPPPHNTTQAGFRHGITPLPAPPTGPLPSPASLSATAIPTSSRS